MKENRVRETASASQPVDFRLPSGEQFPGRIVEWEGARYYVKGLRSSYREEDMRPVGSLPRGTQWKYHVDA